MSLFSIHLGYVLGALPFPERFARARELGFGAVEIPRRRYRALLDRAIAAPADFGRLPLDRPFGGAQALQIIAELAR